MSPLRLTKKSFQRIPRQRNHMKWIRRGILMLLFCYAAGSIMVAIYWTDDAVRMTGITFAKVAPHLESPSLYRTVELSDPGWTHQHARDLSARLQKHTSEKSASDFLAAKPITAFLEPPLRYPSGDEEQKSATVLHRRTQSPHDLHKIVYPLHKASDKATPPKWHTMSCLDDSIPSILPVDAGPQFDANDGQLLSTNIGDMIEWSHEFVNARKSEWNVQNNMTKNEQYMQPDCSPVDRDPFLPWIHDIFLAEEEGTKRTRKVKFVAQNRRRCMTGTKDVDQRWVTKYREPQVALLQSVPVQRISATQAQLLAPDLWSNETHLDLQPTRYRLSTHEDSDSDAIHTRFICRFHTYHPSNGTRWDIGETLSRYTFDYELAAFRKQNNKGGLLSRHHGQDNGKFWTSTLLFECPLPSVLQSSAVELKERSTTEADEIAWTLSGHDSQPIFHVDVIPIRSPVRLPPSEDASKDESNIDPGFYLSINQIGPKYKKLLNFDPLKKWGEMHVLPLPEASGRWENLPICPLKRISKTLETNIPEQNAAQSKEREALQFQEKISTRHLLSACLWASSSFPTRGKKQHIGDTQARLREWIEFHLLVGFDHIYVYDNSGAFGGISNISASLKQVTNLFPDNQVTWIDWPIQVCNNNIPAHDNTGERSSQYAAENSCLARYGTRTEWMATFDTDEYLVPQGQHTSLRTVLMNASGTNILSFKSSRGKLRFDASESMKKRVKLTNKTFLHSFNCDGSPIPRPEWAKRARKQIFRTDYVLNHFVHYSAVTKGLVSEYEDASRSLDSPWLRFFDERSERFADEINEAMMIHTKSLDLSQTQNWINRCRFDFKRKFLGCFIGFPWPNNLENSSQTYDPTTGLQYNCFVNKRVDSYWVPKLELAMKERGV